MATIVIFGAGDIARLAHFYFATDCAHEWSPSPSMPAYRDADTFRGPAARAFDEVRATLSRRRCMRMFVALSYAQMNQVRAEKYSAGEGARLRAGQLRQQPLLLPDPVAARRQLLHPGRQHGAAVRPDRQQRHAVERQPHRPRLRPSAITASSARTSSSRGTCASGRSCFIGVNATLRNDITHRRAHADWRRRMIMKRHRAGVVYVGCRAPNGSPRSSDEVDL